MFGFSVREEDGPPEASELPANQVTEVDPLNEDTVIKKKIKPRRGKPKVFHIFRVNGDVDIDPAYKVDLSQSDTNHEQRDKLAALIDEFDDIFSKSKYDLGDAKVPPLSIKTYTDKPIKTKYLPR